MPGGNMTQTGNNFSEPVHEIHSSQCINFCKLRVLNYLYYTILKIC
jgi:hypothetical protein